MLVGRSKVIFLSFFREILLLISQLALNSKKVDAGDDFLGLLKPICV